MISQMESGDMPHGLKNAVSEADDIKIESVGQWLKYLGKYFGLLFKIQFYVRGTGELTNIDW